MSCLMSGLMCCHPDAVCTITLLQTGQLVAGSDETSISCIALIRRDATRKATLSSAASTIARATRPSLRTMSCRMILDTLLRQTEA